jgi:hypothetical protein
MVIATQGQDKIHYSGFRNQAGFVNATESPFLSTVEDND